MAEVLIWEAIPFTEQRYQHLLEVEAGMIWWDPVWQKYRKTGSPRGSYAVRPSIDFIDRFGLAYQTQKVSRAGWFNCGLTTDGQMLLAHWKAEKRRKLDGQFKSAEEGHLDRGGDRSDS